MLLRNEQHLSCSHFISFIRFTNCASGKYKQIREILDPLPERRFDPGIVRVPYVEDFGTAYLDAYEQVPTIMHPNMSIHVKLLNISIYVYIERERDIHI